MKKLFFIYFLFFNLSSFAKLDTTFLVQVYQSDGCFGICPPTGARILKSGIIEEFQYTVGSSGRWVFMGKITTQKMQQLTAVANALINQPLYTDPDQPVIMDIPEVTYEARNIKDETVLIAREAERNSYLLQAGVEDILRILKGLRSLSTVQN